MERWGLKGTEPFYATDAAIAGGRTFESYGELLELASKSDTSTVDVLRSVRGFMHTHITEEMGKVTFFNKPQITIDPADLEFIWQRIDPSDMDVLGRLEKFKKERNLPDPVAHLVGAVLYRNFNIPRNLAENAARALFDKLIQEKPKKSPIEVEGETSKKDEEYLRNLLDKGMWFSAFSDEEGTIAQQLKHPFKLASAGLIARPGLKNQEEFGIETPQTLLMVLSELRNPESAIVLEDWIKTQLSSEYADYCISFLRSLAEFTTFLDSPSFFQMYASKDKVASLLPFRTLYQAVSMAKSSLQESTGYEEQIKSLEVTEQIIRSRFHQIFQGPMGDSFETENIRDLDPLLDDLVLKFWDWAQPQLVAGELTPGAAAKYAVNFLNIMGLDNIESFAKILMEHSEIDGFNGLSETVGWEIIKEAVRVNALTDESGEVLNQLMLESLSEMQKNPWQDLNDYNFAELFDNNVKKIQIYYMPGTFGPWTHHGHGDFLGKALSYMDYLDKLDAQEGRAGEIRRILVIAPNIKTSRTPNSPKKFENTGTAEERVGAIMLQNPDLDHNRVFITTKLQPDPQQAGDLASAINDFQHRFSTRLHGNMTSAGRAAGQEVEMVLCCGIDEIYKPDREGGVRLAKKEELSPKFRRKGKTLFVGRYGYLIKALEDCEEITKMVDADFVLTPGTPFTSSSEAIRQLLRHGNSPNVLATALPFIARHWGAQKIKERRNEKRREEGKVPSVRRIHYDTIGEYKELLREIGVAV